MNEYDFTLGLPGLSDLTDAQADALFAACGDCTPGSCGGVVSLDFTRAAATREAAVAGAVADLRAAGFDAAPWPG